MHPDGRRKTLIDPERQPDDQKTDDQHDKDGRAIARIGKTVIQPAGAAGGLYGQKTIEQPAVAATRAAAFEPDLDGIYRREIAVSGF
ncbi:hypothetical protein D3C86_1428900 [compost metagenome]